MKMEFDVKPGIIIEKSFSRVSLWFETPEIAEQFYRALEYADQNEAEVKLNFAKGERHEKYGQTRRKFYQ